MSNETSVITSLNHSFEPGDFITTPLHNSLRKIIWHWIFQIPLKRSKLFKITKVTNNTVIVNE